jgi:fructoselysine-6-P-deglycase FrlB-like protein
MAVLALDELLQIAHAPVPLLLERHARHRLRAPPSDPWSDPTQRLAPDAVVVMRSESGRSPRLCAAPSPPPVLSLDVP